jgi:hypothetical protein
VTALCFSQPISHKTANADLRDVVHVLHEGVNHLQNAIRLRGTGVSVVSYIPTRKVRLSLRLFSRNSQMLNVVVGSYF